MAWETAEENSPGALQDDPAATRGKGIASELVNGFVSWCHGQESISPTAGGVAHDNPAATRVLEKNGFQLVRSRDDIAQGSSYVG
jgi:RimJ/RimL family protein N-acetyltransferase